MNRANTSAARPTPLDSSGPLGIVGAIVAMLWPFAVGIGLAALLHNVLPGWIGSYYSRLVIDIGIAMILAVSLNIVNGMTGQFSIGHAGFMALGGYSAGFITYYGSLLLWGSYAKHGELLGPGSCLFVLSCIAGGFVAAGAGYVVGLPSLRLRGDYLAIVTLGFGEIVRVLLQRTAPRIKTIEEVREVGLAGFIPPPVNGSVGFDDLPKYTNLFWVYVFVAFTVIAAYRIKRSSLGRAMISIREDEIASQAMGVSVARIKVLAFVLAAFFAGAAGGLFAHLSGVLIQPRDAGFQRSFDYLIMVVLGGRGSITGVMLAATILTALPEILRDFEEYRLYMLVLLLIVSWVMAVRGGRGWISGVLLTASIALVAMPEVIGGLDGYHVIIQVVLSVLLIANLATVFLRGRAKIGDLLLAASIFLATMPEVLRVLGEYRLIVYATLLILMMLVRPQGLFGIHEIWDFWPRRRAADASEATA